MTHELFAILSRSTLAASATLLVVLMLRKPIRLWLGATLAYRLWLLVPVASIAILLPPPVRPLNVAVQLAPSSVPVAPSIMAATTQALSTFDAKPWLLAIWAIGVVGALMIFMAQQRRYIKNLGALVATDNGEWRATSNVGCPALVGALRPRIVLPQDFETRYTPPERDLVRAHERTHLRRGDAQVNALVALLRCLHWFNPLFHFAASRFRFDQELACDALVIGLFPQARRCYADAMLKAQLAAELKHTRSLPAGCHWPSSHPLKERIAMLKFSVLTPRRRTIASALVIVLTFGVGYASWAAKAPQSISEDNEPLFKIDGKFFIGEQEIIDSIGLIGGEKWPLTTLTGDTPETRWTLTFTIHPSQFDNKQIDLRIEHLGASVTIKGANVALNQPIEIFSSDIAAPLPAEFHAAGPVNFKGKITPVDQVALCEQMKIERRTQLLHVFDVKVPPADVSIGGGNMEMRGDRIHVVIAGTDTLEFAKLHDGFATNAVRIRASDLPGQQVSLQLERFRDKASVGTETRTVALNEPVQLQIADGSSTTPVSFMMRPILPEDLVPRTCSGPDMASSRVE